MGGADASKCGGCFIGCWWPWVRGFWRIEEGKTGVLMSSMPVIAQSDVLAGHFLPGLHRVAAATARPTSCKQVRVFI